MVTSRVPGLIDYLVATFTTAATLGQAVPPVLVFDGPQSSADPAPLVLYVGLDDAYSPPGQIPQAADSQQTRSRGYSLQHREETATIHCSAVAWAGTDDLGTIRRSAYAITAAVEDLVRNDKTQFGGNGNLADPGVSGLVLQQDATSQGAIAQVMFTITFRCFIGV